MSAGFLNVSHATKVAFLAPRASSPVLPAEGDAAPATAGAASIEAEAAGDTTLQDIDLTPRTANKIAEAAAANSATKKRATKPKAPKVHKAIVDEQTELAPRPRVGGDSQSQSQTTLGAISGGMATKEDRLAAGLIKQTSYLPSTVLAMRLQEIQKNPRAHFFSGMSTFGSGNKENETFYAGPPGLPKQLQSLFSFQINRNGTVLGAKRPVQAVAEGEQGKDMASKRARSATAPASDVPDVELGRERQSSVAGGFEPMHFGNTHEEGGDDFGMAGMDTTNDFQLDLGDQDAAVDIANASRAIMEKTPSRLGAVASLDASLKLDLDAIDRARNSMLAVFDSASKASQSTQNQATTSTPMKRKRDGLLSAPYTRMTEASLEEQEETQASNVTAASGRGRTGGWSRNTVKAMKILEHELGPAEEADSKTLSFGSLADKVNIRLKGQSR